MPLEHPPVLIAGCRGSIHGLASSERYRLDGFWCLNLFAGVGELDIAGSTHAFGQRSASITAPGYDHEYRFRGRAVLTWLHFRPGAGRTSAMAVMHDLGASAAALRATALAACDDHQRWPERAASRLWDILFTLAERTRDASDDAVHPAVRLALQELGDPGRPIPSIADLARRVGVSHAHLNRLFHAAVGTSIVDWAQRRRMELARHLLVGTRRRIGDIAREVGIPDAHLFNKTVRARLGASPRAIRQRGA